MATQPEQTDELSGTDWKRLAQDVEFDGRAVIDGQLVGALSGKTYACRYPGDGTEIGQVAHCDAEDVDRAVVAARNAYETGVWSRLAPMERKKILLSLAELVEEHKAELALLETLDTGKPIQESYSLDLSIAQAKFEWYAEAIDKMYGELAPLGPGSICMVQHASLGVVGCITPWNFPLNMAAQKAIPALAAGNTVVLKPAEQTPLSTIRLGQLALEAGLPPGVLNIVPGFGETAGAALAEHKDVDCIAFTGSTEVGKKILQAAGKSNLKRVSLECGGKSPNIILADCPDMELAAKHAAFGIFTNQGEICDAGSRLIVQESIKAEMLERIIANAKERRPGDPLLPETRMGAILDQVQFDRVMGYIEAGQEEGAKIIEGGSEANTGNGGRYIEPTVFDGVRSDMQIAREEIFGPVLSVITVKDAEEAISAANKTIYGLSAGVWTRDINTAFRVADAIRAGIVWINAFDLGHITVPFGGFKQSGFGRDRSLHAITKFTDTKSIWVNLSEEGASGYV